jgi:hypothetical protein
MSASSASSPTSLRARRDGHDHDMSGPVNDDDSEPRVTIGESAVGEDEDDAPTGLPPEERRSGPTVDDEPETQETG